MMFDEIDKVLRRCNQMQPRSQKVACKLLKMVARDGIGTSLFAENTQLIVLSSHQIG